MNEFDSARVKAALSDVRAQRLPATNLRRPLVDSTARRARSERVGELFRQAGIDIDELNRIALDDRAEKEGLRRERDANFDERAVEAQQRHQREVDTFRRLLDASSATNAQPLDLVALEEPVDIEMSGSPESARIETQSHIEPWNSWAKVKIDVNAGDGDASCDFVFVWVNKANNNVIVGPSSTLAFTGNGRVGSNHWLFGGDWAELSISAWLDVVIFETGSNLLLSSPQRTTVLSLSANSQGWFNTDQTDSGSFELQSFRLAHNSFVLPPNYSAAFVVSFLVDYGWPYGSDETFSDFVQLDLFNDNNRVGCPFVELQVTAVD